MTPELTADSPGEASKQVPSTAGMTTKVVKGSMWTLAGQVAPLAVSLVTTPFVIRMLGAEGYGAFILVTLIPTYFAFADFGMSMASTKFASAAYAEGDEEKEARIVRTAALIALCTSIPIAGLLVVFSGAIIASFNVPDYLSVEATLALRITSVTLVIGFLNGIFNTPQLTRLRMDLNTTVNAGVRIAGLIAMALVVYLGHGIIGAVIVLFVASLLNLAGHAFVSGRFLRLFSSLRFEGPTARRILRFGGSLVIVSAAAILVANTEKLVLTSLVSVEALAYYSVAFTLASMMTLFSQAMVQSLIPAFSQLQDDETKEHLNSIYLRGLRLNVVLLIPSISIFIVIAKPFFRLWAGPDFAEISFVPFLILLAGLSFNIPAFIPCAAIMAAGRAGLLARLYVFELVPYVLVVYLLVSHFGILGAALAWSLRISVDALCQFVFARRLVGPVIKNFRLGRVFISIFIVALPPIVSLWFGSYSVVPVGALLICLPVYATFVWLFVLERNEADWIRSKVSRTFGRQHASMY